MTNDELFATVCHPLPERTPRRSLSLRAFTLIAGIAIVCGVLAAAIQIYEVMK